MMLRKYCFVWVCLIIGATQDIIAQQEPSIPNFLPVSKEGMWGAIDTTGKLITPLEYQYIMPTDNGLFKACKGDYCGALNEQGQAIIPCEYNTIYHIFKNIWKTRKIINKDTLFGLYHQKKGIILPAEYPHIDYDKSIHCCIIKKNKKYGVVDSTGNLIVPIEYDELTWLYNPNPYIKVRQANKIGLFTQTGEVLLPTSYQTIVPASYDYFFVRNEAKVGLASLRKNNRLPLPCQYDTLKVLSNELCWVGKYINQRLQVGLFSIPSGKWIIPIQFDNFEVKNQTILASKDNTKQLWDMEGFLVMPNAVFDEIVFDSVGVFRYRQKNLWGITSRQGQLSPTFEEIFPFKGNFALVGHQNKFGIINRFGQIILPASYKKEDFRIGERAIKVQSTPDKIEIILLSEQGNITERYTYYGKINRIKVTLKKEYDFELGAQRPIRREAVNIFSQDISDTLFKPADFQTGKMRWQYQDKQWIATERGITLPFPKITYARQYPESEVAVLGSPIEKDKRILDAQNNVVVVQRAGDLYYTLINLKTGKLLLPFDNYSEEILNNLIKDFEKGDNAAITRGYVGKDSTFLHKIQGIRIKKTYPFVQNISAFILENGKDGAVNRKGQIIIQPIYNKVVPQDDTPFVYVGDGVYKGATDTTGKLLLPPFYEDLQTITSNRQVYLVFSNYRDSYNFVDEKGRLLLEKSVTIAQDFSEGFAPICVDTTWGYVNTRGKKRFVTGGRLQYATPFSEGLAWITWRDKNKKALLDTNMQCAM